MRRAVVMTVVSLLAACGGGENNNNGNNNNGTVRSFTYAAPAAPTTAQKATATKAQTQLNGVVTATNGGQVVNAASAPELTDSLAASLPASLLASPDPTEVRAEPSDGPMAAVRRSSALSGNCITVSGSSITYANCSLSETGYTITLNGNLTSSTNTVTWNLTETYAYSASGYVLNGTATWIGNLTGTATTIVGQGRSTYHYTGNYQNISISYDYVAAIDMNLTYSTAPYCITGGTLEIRRAVTSSSNSNATPVKDAALKFTWTGCNQYTVAKGT